MPFSNFSKKVHQQLTSMAAANLFLVDVEKDELFQVYLAAFPEGSNPMHKTRTEHDCTCCRQFINRLGGVVALTSEGVKTIWDVEVPGEPAYTVVAKALADYVRTKAVVAPFFSKEKKIGNETTRQNVDGKVVSHNHFYFELPLRHVVAGSQSVEEKVGEIRTHKELLERGVKEITLESCQTVLDLINQNSLYRGAEHKSTVNLAISLIKFYNKAENKEEWLLVNAYNNGFTVRFKNTVIGTLLTDLSSGVDLEDAVRMFESKVAPQNYKRTTALVTPAMIKKAEQTVEDLGIKGAISRRHARAEDVSIVNVLFADRSTKKVMKDAFASLTEEVSGRVSSGEFSKVQKVSIGDFISNVLPGAESIELSLSNKHISNLVSLVAPVDSSAGNILKWDNNFTWSYNGEVTDSIKEKVKKAGGKVDGYMRVSLSWFNYDDLDLHVYEPDGTHIYFRNKAPARYAHSKAAQMHGQLDVDMNAGTGRSREAVENIFWRAKEDVQEGKYRVIVNNFSQREKKDVGFVVEFDVNGESRQFVFDKEIRSQESIKVIEFNYSKKSGVKFIQTLPETTASRDVWNIQTNKWTKVKMMMLSPNYWDNNSTGNKHYFFMLEGCENPDPVRGFYNEFLRGGLEPHRKVFEVLASKLKADYCKDQLSGVGFSSTVPNSVLCKVTGSFNRTIEITF